MCSHAAKCLLQRYPSHRAKEIAKSLKRGEEYILSIQRKDGSWYGSWGVCFTYGVWFGCEALAALGYTFSTSDSLRRACSFLISKQREDGGWGESYLSCQVSGDHHPSRQGETPSLHDFRHLHSRGYFLTSSHPGDPVVAPGLQDKVYSQLEGDESHVVNTAWAMMALLYAG